MNRIIRNVISEIRSCKINLCEDFDILEKIRLHQNVFDESFERILVVGFGASISNLKAILCSIPKSKYHRNIMFLSTIDNETLDFITQEIINLKTKIVFISNSGETDEIIFLYRHFSDIFTDNFHPLVFCSNEQSTLSLMVKNHAHFCDEMYMNYSLNLSTSGRFAVFSFCNFLIAKALGVNVEKIIGYFQGYINDFSFEDEIIEEVTWTLENYDKNRRILVDFYYFDRLKWLILWRKQVISESLGKNGFGITLLEADGTNQEHSQLQLFLDGYNDKFFKIYYCELDSNIKTNRHALNTYNNLINHDKSAKLYIVNQVSEEYITKNILLTYITTISIARIKNLNPFDQKAVDMIKNIA